MARVDTLSLQLSYHGSPALACGGGGKRYIKDIIRCGKFVKDSQGIEFEVTADTLRHWAATFHAMQANGCKVPLPMTHKNDGNPSQNAGWVADMFVEGDRLKAILDIDADDAESLIRRTDVSVFAPPRWRDGAGNEYVRPITHVALCTDPLIPGLGDFVPMAASQENAMDPVMLMELLGLDPATPAEEQGAAIQAAIEALIAEIADLRGEGKEPPAAGDAPPAAGDGAPPLDEEKLAASRDPLVIKMIGKNRSMSIDGLVQVGKLSAAAGTKLKQQYCADGRTIAASLKGDPDNSRFEGLISALEANAVYPTGEHSGRQVLAASLGDQVSNPAKNPLLADANRRAEEAKR